jgi:hypothetical protein
MMYLSDPFSVRTEPGMKRGIKIEAIYSEEKVEKIFFKVSPFLTAKP